MPSGTRGRGEASRGEAERLEEPPEIRGRGAEVAAQDEAVAGREGVEEDLLGDEAGEEQDPAPMRQGAPGAGEVRVLPRLQGLIDNRIESSGPESS